jgi:hypothetical protein
MADSGVHYKQKEHIPSYTSLCCLMFSPFSCFLFYFYWADVFIRIGLVSEEERANNKIKKEIHMII